MLPKKNTWLISKHNRQILPWTSGFGVTIDDMANADHVNIVFVVKRRTWLSTFEPTTSRAQLDRSFVPTSRITMSGLKCWTNERSCCIILSTVRPPVPCKWTYPDSGRWKLGLAHWSNRACKSSRKQQTKKMPDNKDFWNGPWHEKYTLVL